MTGIRLEPPSHCTPRCSRSEVVYRYLLYRKLSSRFLRLQAEKCTMTSWSRTSYWGLSTLTMIGRPTVALGSAARMGARAAAAWWMSLKRTMLMSPAS